ncbi:sugar phosphate nucleotidyltransferase [Kitasatospora sp. A2-31]|uniref:nucleotidyltransferase family protein n=1 Tax=Kitasatospora sp. A2-31 TaxID=2916414 RepID=UPI001EE9F2EF|nr:sugar phosphate nucleotidyltransferase [Kitasatospora sp. A2-31]MCG6495362.1 NTP transferase domain-containing protein [Kitasatospora sp. A2-31]
MNARPFPGRPTVVLLCGGLGLRQRSDGDDLPKPLRPLPDGRALILHVLDYYRSFGLDDFVLCTGYGARAMEQLLLGELPAADIATGPGWLRLGSDGIRVTLVDSGPYAEKCVRLLDAAGHLRPGPFLLGYGDVLSDFDLGRLAERREESGATVTMTATRVRSRYGELVVGPGMEVTAFVEKPLQPALISAGYFACSPRLLAALSPELGLEEDVLPALAARGEVDAVVHDGRWLPFDTYKDFVDAEALAAQEGFPWPTPVRV